MGRPRGFVFRACSIRLVGAAAGLACACGAIAQIEHRTIAISGQQAPGLEPGTTIVGPANWFAGRYPSINSSGDVAFIAIATTPNLTPPFMHRHVAWICRAGELTPIAVEGRVDPEPGGEGSFSELRRIDLTESGAITIAGRRQLPGRSYFAIWSDRGDGMRMVGFDGMPVPGVAEATLRISIEGVDQYATNRSGSIAMYAALEGPSITSETSLCVALDSGSGLQIIARAGDILPSPEGPVTLGRMTTVSYDVPPSPSGVDTVLFPSLARNESVNPALRHGIWQWSGSAPMQCVGITWAPSPIGGDFTFFDPPQVNDRGDIALIASTRSPDRWGIWSGPVGGIQPIAIEGENAPCPAAGGPWAFKGFSGNASLTPSINDHGRVAFHAIVRDVTGSSPSREGLWQQAREGFRCVALTGERAAGTGPDVLWSNFSVDSGLAVANDAQVAFGATLSGPGVDSSNAWGLWLTDHAGRPHLVVRAGYQFDVDDDSEREDLRVVKSIYPHLVGGSISGSGNGLSDSGELAFSIDFTDGSWGVFVARVSDVCEADWDGSGGTPDTEDFVAYLADFVSRGSRADLAPAASAGDPRGDGVFDSSDFLAFLNLCAQGC